MLTVKNNRLMPTTSNFLDSDWNSIFDWSTGNNERNFTVPAVNIKETKDDFLVEVACPGMKKDDFKIELNNNVLTISSEIKQEDENKEEGYTRKEFHYNSFKRSFNLNDQLIDEDKIKATYKDGVLNLCLPKREEAKPKPIKLIEIK